MLSLAELCRHLSLVIELHVLGHVCAKLGNPNSHFLVTNPSKCSSGSRPSSLLPLTSLEGRRPQSCKSRRPSCQRCAAFKHRRATISRSTTCVYNPTRYPNSNNHSLISVRPELCLRMATSSIPGESSCVPTQPSIL